MPTPEHTFSLVPSTLQDLQECFETNELGNLQYEYTRRAVNAFEPMREALQAALYWLDPNDNATSDALTAIVDKIRAALALAEEK